MNFDDERVSENKNQMLVDRIDDVLNQNRHSSIYVGDAESIDLDARSMLDDISSPKSGKRSEAGFEEDDIIKTTRELLAQLKSD